MSIMAAILIVVCVWWLTFFVVLTIGVSPDPNPKPGMAWGHPTHVPMLRKVVITTCVSSIISAALIGYLYAFPLDFRLPLDHPSFLRV